MDSRWRVGTHGQDSRHKHQGSNHSRRQQPRCVETCRDTKLRQLMPACAITLLFGALNILDEALGQAMQKMNVFEYTLV